MILLDTHVLLWFFSGSERLGLQTRSRVEDALRRGEATVSAISLWEISLLIDKRRVDLGMPLRLWVDQVGGAGRVRFIGVSV